MTVTNDVLTGYAALIAANSLGVWNSNGVYALTDLAVYLKTMPDGPTIPDRCIVLNLIPLTDQVNVPLGRSILQIAARGARNNPIDVDNILDPIFDLFQNRTNDIFGVTTVVQCLRMGSTPMGQDQNVRFERADKFDLDISYTPTLLRPVSG